GSEGGRAQPSVAADAAHGTLGVGVIGNNGTVPLCLRPACGVRQVVRDGEAVVRSFDPADGRNVPQNVAVGVLDPERALDVVRLYGAADRLVEFWNARSGNVGKCNPFTLVQRAVGEEGEPHSQLAVDELAGPTFVFLTIKLIFNKLEPARRREEPYVRG